MYFIFLLILQITDMRGDMDGWTIIDLNDEWFTYFPTQSRGWLQYETFPARDQNYIDYDDRSIRDVVIYYWQAPMKYYGNRVANCPLELIQVTISLAPDL